MLLSECFSKPVVKLVKGQPIDAAHPPSKLLTDSCAADDYYLAPSSKPKDGVTVDLGCIKWIKSFTLQNTNNGGKNDRGTKKFKIMTSVDGLGWTKVNIILPCESNEIFSQSVNDIHH